jgi:hypothetical protein
MEGIAHDTSGPASPKPPDSKRADPTRPTGASFASSSPIAATTWASPTSWMRRSMLAALSASSTDTASPVVRTGGDASAT